MNHKDRSTRLEEHSQRDLTSPEEHQDAELQRRLDRIEQPGGGGMVQSPLPWTDLVIVVGLIIVVASLLLVWAR